ncbi:MAG: amino acid ABC transporter substrate-binding protein [Eubacteriales bacterium]|nr:amino acid ABC transporter substrate-binding protein [Eubacteriales bacterium]MDD3882743.1 amino acid ABC transporter substrate-binding protein [Eubacteriales bacterium]MDD4512636.1 amino acid ABC transporter substrate-binding protein [Eubacteriales bacterium]
MKKIIAVLLAAILLFSVSAAAVAEDGSLEYVMNNGRLILGLDDSFPPMGYRDENNDIVGFDIDLAAAVCAKLGIELVVQPIDWSSKELELDSKNIDCIWNGMSITPARTESMAMTFPYLNNQIAFYTRTDSDIKSTEDLVGKKVAVQGGSTADDLLANDFADVSAAFAETLSYDEYLTALMDLQQGGVDAVAIDVCVAEFKISGMGADDIKQAFVLADDNYGIGFRKDDIALRDKIQEVLIELKKDGTVAGISEKWFGSDITVIPAE